MTTFTTILPLSTTPVSAMLIVWCVLRDNKKIVAEAQAQQERLKSAERA